VEWRIELVFVPVADLDRAAAFYRESLGFTEDFDTRFGDDVRMIQLTPPGSACSIALIEGLAPGPGLEHMPPGSLHGLQVVVDDLGAARTRLTEHGVEVSDVLEVVQEGGTSVYRPVLGEPIGWNAYAFFNDPDGNGWVLQQRPPEGDGGDR
jgi:catechol 2,3-dioxygenase-like lactoylglutathione lyase family enzyme